MAISPGVYSEIIDRSDFTPENLVAGHFGLFPIASKRGEDNVVKLMTGLPQSDKVYGEPVVDRYGLSQLYSNNWLEGGSSAYVCRLLPDNATFANTVLYLKDNTTSGSLPVNDPSWKGEFTALASYQEGDLVEVEGKVYSALVDFVALDDFDVQDWKEETVLAFRRNGRYAEGAYVSFEGSLYLKLTAEEVSRENPKVDTNNWGLIKYTIVPADLIVASYGSIENMTQKEHVAVGGDKPVVTFRPIGRGQDYNKLYVRIEYNKYLENTYRFVTYDVTVFDTDGENNLFQLGDSLTVSLDPTALDLSGESMFAEHVFNRYSNTVRVNVDTEELERIVSGPYSAEIDKDFDIEDLYTFDILGLQNKEPVMVKFENGSDGDLLNAMKRIDFDVFNGLVAKFFSGTVDRRITNWKEIQAKVIFDCAYNNAARDAMESFVKNTRPDIFAFMGTQYAANEEQVLDARSETHSYDNYRVSIKPGFYETYDRYSGRDVRAPALLRFVTNISSSWLTNGIHVPVAGYNDRGSISGIRPDTLAFNPDKTYQDLFYLARLNPIIRDPSGYYMMGTQTTQTKSSAMSNESVVNMIQVIDTEVKIMSEQYLFDFITPATIETIQNNVNTYFDKWFSNNGVEEVNINVFASEADKKNKQVRVEVTIKPTGFIEKILLTFIVV